VVGRHVGKGISRSLKLCEDVVHCR
jgi:hypothetical protein